MNSAVNPANEYAAERRWTVGTAKLKKLQVDLHKVLDTEPQGSVVPDFACDTAVGSWDSFLKWKAGKWTILCTHPADFTPVSTTELLDLAERYNKFEALDCKLAALSVDTVATHKVWERDILAIAKTVRSLPFPIIADPTRAISAKYGIMDHEEEADKLPVTMRSVSFIGPDDKLELSLNYPTSVGLNVDEMIRCLEALQLSSRRSLVTPANWPQNDIPFPVEDCDMHGAVFISPSVTSADASMLFPGYHVCPVPSGKDYLRFVKAASLVSSGRIQGNSTKDISFANRVREVQRWPGHLRLLEVRVYGSALLEGDGRALLDWKKGAAGRTQMFKEFVTFFSTLLDLKIPEILFALVLATARWKVAALAAMIAIVLLFGVSLQPGKLRAWMFNGLFTHFFAEMVFEDGRTCVLERSAKGVFLYQGTSNRAGKQQVVSWNAAVSADENVRLSQVRFFAKQQNNELYDAVYNSAKNLMYELLTRVLQQHEFDSYEEFQDTVVAWYCQQRDDEESSKTVPVASSPASTTTTAATSPT